MTRSLVAPFDTIHPLEKIGDEYDKSVSLHKKGIVCSQTIEVGFYRSDDDLFNQQRVLVE